MGTTTRFLLPYPELTDAPNGPEAVSELALATEGWLARAIPCTSGTRPAGPPTGMLIRESDTSAVLIWTGTVWEQLNLATQVGADYQASASSDQSIATGSGSGIYGRQVAFGTEDTANAAVTRATVGTGHQFTLNTTGRWVVSATVRFASNGTTGIRYAGLYSSANLLEPLTAASGHEGDAATLPLSLSRRFTAGTALTVCAYQDSGGTRSLERGVNGGWVRINLALVGP